MENSFLSTDETGKKSDFISACRNEQHSRIPVWFMRQAGRCLPEFREIRAKAGGFLDLCYNPKLATEVTLQPIRRFGMDASIVFADILLVPDGLGQKLDYVAGKGPVLEPIRSVSDLSRLSLEKLHSRVGPVYETISGVAERLPKDVTLIGFAGAPWTLATYLINGRGEIGSVTAKKFLLSNFNLKR